MKRIPSSAIASIAALIASTSLYAAPIVGTSSGVFVNPTGPGLVVSGVGTSNFAWGVGYYSPPSSLGFSGANFNTQTEQVFSFGTLSYYNGVTLGGEALGVGLDVTTSFTTPSGVNGSFLYNLGLINTTNTGDPYASADIVQFQNTFPSSTFTSDGIIYTLEFLGFGNITPGGYSTVNQFHVLEGATASAELLGRVTSHIAPVPEPETYAMLLLGIGLIGFQRLRQKGTQDSPSMLGMA